MRLFGLVFLLCVVVDFADPMLPGAVCLDDGATVHGTRAERARLALRPLREPTREPAAMARPARAVQPAPATEPIILGHDGGSPRPIRAAERTDPPPDDH